MSGPSSAPNPPDSRYQEPQVQKCLACNSPAYYVGFSSSECTNPRCQWYFQPKEESVSYGALDFISFADPEDAFAWIREEVSRRLKDVVAGITPPPWPKPITTYLPTAGVLAVTWPDHNTRDLYTWEFTF